ncbi:YdbH domain-containing protein [Dongia mobilis]|uniref:intermembrane phospholipid transport protein YdbH family protein n=1 Tax=Dongia sp. TaxID=1977262 RepID=UPI0026EF4DBB
MVPSDPSRDQPPAPVSPPAPGSPSAPASLPKRRLSPGRRLLRLMLRLVALLLLAVAVSLVFRVDLLNRTAPWLISRELAVPADLAIRNLDWRSAHIDRLILGGQRDLVIEDVNLTYDPWSGRLDSVEIGRVALLARYDTSLSLGELDPLLDRLRAMAAAPADPDAPATPLPDILVKSIDIGIASPVGFITGSGQANLNAQAVIAQFTLREQQDYARIDISLAAPLVKGGKPPLGDLTLVMDTHSALWPLVGLAQPTGGNIKASAHLRMPDSDPANAAAADAPLALAEWSLEAVDFAYPGLPAPLAGSLAGTAAYGKDWLTLDKIAGGFKGGLSAPFTARLGGNLRVSPLLAAQEISGALSLAADGGDLAFPGFAASQVKLALDLALKGKLDAAAGSFLDLTLTRPGSLSAHHLNLAEGAILLPKPTTLALLPDPQPAAHITFGGAGGLAADLNLALGKSTLTVEPKAAAERLLIAMPNARLSGRYDAAAPLALSFTTKGAQVVAPTRGLTLGNVALSLVSDAKGIAAKLSTGALAGLGAFTPVRGEVDATLLDGKASFKARFTGDDQPIDLQLSGKGDLAKSSFTVDLKLSALDFALGGLQPYNFFPPLRDYLDDVSGRVELEGPVRYAGGAFTSDLKFGLTNFSGKVGPVLLTNVNSVIAIDKPWPLSTKPDQVVAVELADIGLPLTNALFRFKVSDGKRLDLQESRIEMAGGRVSLDPAILLFDAPAHNLKLTVDSISVGELFDTLGIAGLTGEGSISGDVPVTIFPGGIAIPAAKLAATAPGVLRYDRNQAPLALQSAGESVAMALEALADFHYEKLILDLSRSLAGDVTLGLHISGRNPSFYDGYPVEFNLTVEGQLDQALKEGLAGYRVPDMIQQQLEKLSP